MSWRCRDRSPPTWARVLQKSIDELITLAKASQRREIIIMANTQELEAAISALEAEVTEQTSVQESTVTLLGTLNQMLKDALAAGGTSDAIIARVKMVTAKIDEHTNKLAAAAAANTPSAPPPPPTDAPTDTPTS